MILNELWFILIGVLFTGFFILEGFDFGVGMLLPFLGKKDIERRQIINTIGPHWDANEVWLITAGGAMFAAFPQWYATMFSGFYLALFLILVGLILRGVAFEFRSKMDSLRWRKIWDWSIFFGSVITPLLFGVVFANLFRGLPIDSGMNFSGNLFTLLNGFSLVAGLTFVAVSLLEGILYLNLKTTDDVHVRTQRMVPVFWGIALSFSVLLAVLIFVGGLAFSLAAILFLVGILMLAVVGWLIKLERYGWGFILVILFMVLTATAYLLVMFPNVMVAEQAANNLTIYNSASSPYSLKVMSFIALTFVPFMLGYQIYSYWVFRKRVTTKPEHMEY